MRIGGWAGKTLGKLGLVAQQIAGGDIYPALEKGTIDATEWVGPYDDEKLGFYKVAKYYYYPGWWEGGTANHLLINLAKWNELPKSYQAIVERRPGLQYASNWPITTRATRRRSSGWLPTAPNFARSRLGHGGLPEGVEEVNAETSATNPDYKKVWDSIVAFRNDEYLWWQVAEYGYDTFMIRSRARG